MGLGSVSISQALVLYGVTLFFEANLPESPEVAVKHEQG